MNSKMVSSHISLMAIENHFCQSRVHNNIFPEKPLDSLKLYVIESYLLFFLSSQELRCSVHPICLFDFSQPVTDTKYSVLIIWLIWKKKKNLKDSFNFKFGIEMIK